MSTATAANGQQVDDEAFPHEFDDILDKVDGYNFVWPTQEDADHATKRGLFSWSSTQNGLNRCLYQRKVVVVSRDTDESQRAAQELAEDIDGAKAAEVKLLVLRGYNEAFPNLAAWCSRLNLLRTLDFEWKAGIPVVGKPVKESPDFDEDPRPITAELIPVPAIFPEMIPLPFRAWLQDIADRGCFPPEYTAATLVVVLGGLIGRKVAIRPKRYDDWLVVPNLWGAIVGPPGFLKTPAVEAVLRPLKRLVADAIKAHGDQLAQHAERQLVSAARREAAKTELKKEAKKKDVTDEQLQALAKEAAADNTEGKPTEKRYLVNDFTVEKLGELLADHPNGLTIFRDELSGLLNTLNREGHQSDRGFLLEAWNGNGSYTSDRIGRGTIHVQATCIALFGTIQPGPLTKYMKGTISGEDADGFIPRFQILVYPDPPAEYIHVDRWPDKDAKNEAYEVFKAIDQLDATGRGSKVDDDSGVPYLNFADDAQRFFDEWYTALQLRLRSGELTDVMAAHLAKYGSLMPSLALIFHLVDESQSSALGPVSFDATERAAAWCEVLEAHAQRVYQSCSDGDISTAVNLAERIKASLPNPFTYRVLAQKGWSGLRTVEDARHAVGVLEDRGWVKVVEELPELGSKGGRPSEKVWINPRIRTEDSGVNA
jgi:hypothetical protein